MNLLHRFIEFIEAHQLFTKKEQLLLAVSGGIDSVVLCYLCKQAGYNFSIAHCNFKLRGDESNRDEAFVKELSANYNIPFLVNHFDTKAYATANKSSIQVAARELRYHWFHELVNESHTKSNTSSLTTHYSPFTYVLTAHHADDNIETVLMNLFKGTGISGLHGIVPKVGKLVRPLVFATREEIVAYAKENQLNWVEDSSNAETKYTRNFFRHELIPGVQKMFPAVKENMIASIQRFSEAEEWYDQAINTAKKKLLEVKGEEVHIPILKLQRSTPLNTLVFEIIKDFGFSGHQVGEVIKLLSSESGKYITSATHRILRNRAWLIISPVLMTRETIIVIEEHTSQLSFAGGALHLKTIPVESAKLHSDASIAVVNKSEIEFPLLLRPWKEGDYFYPLGMPKKKKLARFFIDQKLSKAQKEKVWVLESNKRIVWIVGHRIDDRFKITPSTKEVVRISASFKD